MFDVLIYTNCLERQSINGLAGWQFAAASAGATNADQDYLRSHQHAVPDLLPARDWTNHPPTCTYTYDGKRHYLSRGKSTGMAGIRYGNQLTQSIVTDSAIDILPNRPAELFSAPNWNLSMPVSNEVEQWPAPLETADDFAIEQLRSLVEEPWAKDLLPALLTMVESATAERRTKLIIKHSDQRLVLRWIALATRFLDAEAALAVEFRVFAENPVGVPGTIVGAHPRLSPTLTVTSARAQAVNLVDLEAREWTEVPLPASAQRHAAWFLTHDPYEALDAVETSRRWARAMDAETAARAVEVACFGSTSIGPTRESAALATTALTALARSGQADELDAWGESLLESVADYAPAPSDDILPLAECLWSLIDARRTDLAQTAVLKALEWAATYPDAAAAWAQRHRATQRTGYFEWTDGEAQRDGADKLRDLLTHAIDQNLSAIFVLGRWLGTAVPPEANPAIHRLAELWVSRPDLQRDTNQWVNREAVVIEARQVLTERLAAGEPAAIDGLRSGSWDWLDQNSGQVTASDPLSPWLATRTLARLPSSARPKLIRQLRGLPPDAWGLAVSDDQGRIDLREAAAWLEVAPMDRNLESAIVAALRERSGQVGGKRALLDTLVSHDVNIGTKELQGAKARHRQALSAFGDAVAQASSNRNAALGTLRGMIAATSLLYGPEITRVLLDCQDNEGARALAAMAAKRVERLLPDLIAERLHAADLKALLDALRLVHSGHRPWSDRAKQALDTFWDDPVTHDLRDHFRRSLPEAWAPVLDAYERDQGKGATFRKVSGWLSRFNDKEKDRH